MKAEKVCISCMQRLAVLNVVGLSSSLIGERTPRLFEYGEKYGVQSFQPAFPAVTCTAQSSMLTGLPVDEHGVVGNGWFDREACEVKFWKQSNHIVKGKKIWDALHEKYSFTTANLFWWYNMATNADIAVTPRPLYLANGGKHFDIHTQPMNLRDELKSNLGDFPFPSFWGPMAGIPCSQWIASCAKYIEEKSHPHLSLVYLPHLDYCLQQKGSHGNSLGSELKKIDAVVGDLLDFYEQKNVRVIIVSEYGISDVKHAVHLNRELRKENFLSIKDELGRETLDVFQSEAFAVVDHQVAHVYVKDSNNLAKVKSLLEKIQGVAAVKYAHEIWGEGIARDRAGDLIVFANDDAWFTYYYWNDDAKAPDFARTIDIHRKPGYDPAELFIDPEISFPKLKLATFLLKKKLGFKALAEVIPLDATLVCGSHGLSNVGANEQPIIIGAKREITKPEDVFQEMLDHFSAV